MRYIGGFSLLRFYASISVLFGHYLHSFSEVRPYHESGFLDAVLRLLLIEGNAVRFFFVLGGFLFALRLLNERKQTRANSISKFYTARMFRIYPLYFCAFFVGCLVLPIIMPSPVVNIDSVSTIALATFTANIVMPFLGSHVLAHLWSIAAQEQFNLIVLLFLVRGSSVERIGVSIAASWFAGAVIAEASGISEFREVMDYTKFDALAIGMLAGWAYHRNHAILRVLDMRLMRCFVYFSFASLAIIQIYSSSQLFVAAIASPIYVALVLVIARQNRTEATWKTRLGKLSFGVYIWHYPILYTLIYVGVRGEALLFANIGFTLFAATVTYNIIEIPLSKLRNRVTLTYTPQTRAPIA